MVSTAESSTTTRKSRPLRRKTSHSVIERRRREKINEGLITLQATVPACREELQALLLVKAQSDRKNARKAKEVVVAEVEGAVSDKIAGTMMLEKLCIISHTVDYVHELQRIVQGYREMCECEPSEVLAQMQLVGKSQAHANAHSEAFSPTSPPLTPSESESATENADRVTTTKTTNTAACQDCDGALCGAKRQRHWGSNNPMHIDKVTGQKRRRQANAETSPDAESDEEGLELDDWQDRQCMRGRAELVHNDPTLLYANPTAKENCSDCDSKMATALAPRMDASTERERRLHLLASLRTTTKSM
jgi:hypothetical protein